MIQSNGGQSINTYLVKIQRNGASKYIKWYCNIVTAAIKRSNNRKTAKEILGYVEGHHIYPRCLSTLEESADKNNIVFLSAREHYLCHWLLTKIFNDGLSKFKLACAFFKMCNSITGVQERINSKYYQYARKIHAIEKSKQYTGIKKDRILTEAGLLTLKNNGIRTQEFLKNNPEVEYKRRERISETMKTIPRSPASLANLGVDKEASARGREKGLVFRKAFGSKNSTIRIETETVCFYTFSQAMEYFDMSESAIKYRINSTKPHFASWKLIEVNVK